MWRRRPTGVPLPGSLVTRTQTDRWAPAVRRARCRGRAARVPAGPPPRIPAYTGGGGERSTRPARTLLVSAPPLPGQAANPGRTRPPSAGPRPSSFHADGPPQAVIPHQRHIPARPTPIAHPGRDRGQPQSVSSHHAPAASSRSPRPPHTARRPRPPHTGCSPCSAREPSASTSTLTTQSFVSIRIPVRLPVPAVPWPAPMSVQHHRARPLPGHPRSRREPVQTEHERRGTAPFWVVCAARHHAALPNISPGRGPADAAPSGAHHCRRPSGCAADGSTVAVTVTTTCTGRQPQGAVGLRRPWRAGQDGLCLAPCVRRLRTVTLRTRSP